MTGVAFGLALGALFIFGRDTVRRYREREGGRKVPPVTARALPPTPPTEALAGLAGAAVGSPGPPQAEAIHAADGARADKRGRRGGQPRCGAAVPDRAGRAAGRVRASRRRRLHQRARHPDATGTRTAIHDRFRGGCGCIRRHSPAAAARKHALRIQHGIRAQHRRVPPDALPAVQRSCRPQQQPGHQRHHAKGRRHDARCPVARADADQLDCCDSRHPAGASRHRCCRRACRCRLLWRSVCAHHPGARASACGRTAS